MSDGWRLYIAGATRDAPMSIEARFGDKGPPVYLGSAQDAVALAELIRREFAPVRRVAMDDGRVSVTFGAWSVTMPVESDDGQAIARVCLEVLQNREVEYGSSGE